MEQSNPLTLNREQTRELDHRAIEDYKIPSIVLMENAGRGVAEYLLSKKIKGPIIICCGKGNNAGDGFVIARHLDNHHIPVHIILFAKKEELTKDATINFEILVRSNILITIFLENNFDESNLKKILKSGEYVLDALFGTGLQGTVRPPYDKIINTINSHGKNIIAVDIPSGLDCDLGTPLGTAIKAQETISFAVNKQGFTNPEAKKFIGKLSIIDIGIPRKLLDQYSART